MTRVNPYTNLKTRCAEWARLVVNPRVRVMWRYPKDRLNSSWTLSDLYERTATAETLGWTVRLRATSEGLIVEYVKNANPPPWEIQP